METLFKALDDYAVDNRGDVGSWVREAAMDALERCTYILCKRDSSSMKPQTHKLDAADWEDQLFDADIAKKLISGLAKQAVEKIDKIRDIAAKTLQRILYRQKDIISFIPHREVLESIIPSSTDLKWGVSVMLHYFFPLAFRNQISLIMISIFFCYLAYLFLTNFMICRISI